MDSGENNRDNSLPNCDMQDNPVETSEKHNLNKGQKNSMDKELDRQLCANQKPTLESSGKHMSKAVIYSFLRSYGMIPLNLILTMLVSRFLLPDLWGYYIYALSLTTGSRIILNLIPPSSNFVVLYKLPELLLSNQKEKARGLIRYIIKVKFLVGSIASVVYFIIGLTIWLEGTEAITGIVLMIISPIILFDQICDTLKNFINAVKKYQKNTLFVLYQKIILFFGYLFLFLIDWEQTIKLNLLAVLNVFIVLIYIFLILSVYFHIFSNIKAQKINWNDIKSSIAFGSHFSIYYTAKYSYDLAFSNIIKFFGLPRYLVYNNLANNITQQSLQAFSLPIGPILSDLESTDQRERMVSLFQKSMRYVNILICFITGCLYFFIKLYILILYPPEYLESVEFIQNAVFLLYFLTIVNNYQALFSVTKIEKYIGVLGIISMIILTILALVFMKFFSFGGIIISNVIGYAINSLLFWLVGNKKITKFKISFFFLYRQIIELIFIIICVTLFSNYLLVHIDFSTIENLLIQIGNLFFSDGRDLSSQAYVLIETGLKLFIFLIIYILYIIFFRILTKEDIEQMERLNLRIPFKKYIFKIMNKILYKEQNWLKKEKIEKKT